MAIKFEEKMDSFISENAETLSEAGILDYIIDSKKNIHSVHESILTSNINQDVKALIVSQLEGIASIRNASDVSTARIRNMPKASTYVNENAPIGQKISLPSDAGEFFKKLNIFVKDGLIDSRDAREIEQKGIKIANKANDSKIKSGDYVNAASDWKKFVEDVNKKFKTIDIKKGFALSKPSSVSYVTKLMAQNKKLYKGIGGAEASWIKV